MNKSYGDQGNLNCNIVFIYQALTPLGTYGLVKLCYNRNTPAVSNKHTVSHIWLLSIFRWTKALGPTPMWKTREKLLAPDSCDHPITAFLELNYLQFVQLELISLGVVIHEIT